MRYLKFSLLTIFLYLNFSCYSQNTKAVINSVTITLPGPGKWVQTARNESTGQWMLKNEITKQWISLSARPKTALEFYDDTLTDFGLVNAYYKWDAEYWASDNKNEVTYVKTDMVKNYVIWCLRSSQGANLILNGLKDGHLVNIQIEDNSAGEDKKKIKFLESVYLQQ